MLYGSTHALDDSLVSIKLLANTSRSINTPRIEEVSSNDKMMLSQQVIILMAVGGMGPEEVEIKMDSREL